MKRIESVSLQGRPDAGACLLRLFESFTIIRGLK